MRSLFPEGVTRTPSSVTACAKYLVLQPRVSISEGDEQKKSIVLPYMRSRDEKMSSSGGTTVYSGCTEEGG